LWSYSSQYAFAALVTPTYRYYLHSRAGTVAVERQQRMFTGNGSQLLYEDSDFDRLETYAGLNVYSAGGTVYALSVSYRLLVAAAVFTGAISWIPCRFSLRTLLIATTLSAVVLGLIVYATRS
jgi:hypothetical protein